MGEPLEVSFSAWDRALGAQNALAADIIAQARRDGKRNVCIFEDDAVLMPEDESLYLLASDAGYGFLVKGEDMLAKNKNGKALLNLPEGGRILTPQRVRYPQSSHLAAVSNEGRLLVFPLKDLPQLSKGKGNKILSLPSARVKSREEFVAGLAFDLETTGLETRAYEEVLLQVEQELAPH